MLIDETLPGGRPKGCGMPETNIYDPFSCAFALGCSTPRHRRCAEKGHEHENEFDRTVCGCLATSTFGRSRHQCNFRAETQTCNRHEGGQFRWLGRRDVQGVEYLDHDGRA